MPSLLATRDMASPISHGLWAAALELNPDAWCGPADPRGDFDQMLIELIEGGHPPPELLERLSATPLADLSSFAPRKELWSHLNSDLRTGLLVATVDAWFERAEHALDFVAVEPEMEQRILADNRLERLLSQLSDGRIGDGLRLAAVLPGFAHWRLRRWLARAVRATRSITERERR